MISRLTKEMSGLLHGFGLRGFYKITCAAQGFRLRVWAAMCISTPP